MNRLYPIQTPLHGDECLVNGLLVLSFPLWYSKSTSFVFWTLIRRNVSYSFVWLLESLLSWLLFDSIALHQEVSISLAILGSQIHRVNLFQTEGRNRDSTTKLPFLYSTKFALIFSKIDQGTFQWPVHISLLNFLINSSISFEFNNHQFIFVIKNTKLNLLKWTEWMDGRKEMEWNGSEWNVSDGLKHSNQNLSNFSECYRRLEDILWIKESQKYLNRGPGTSATYGNLKSQMNIDLRHWDQWGFY